MAYWLFKTEPDEFGIDDLKAFGKKSAPWDGIRNYQARNLLRDQVQVGDQVLMYHSSCKLIGVAGTAEVVTAAFPDPAQFDPESKYFDAKATHEDPRWFNLEIVFKQKFESVVPLKLLKVTPELSEMTLLKQGRLSVQPVTAQEWNTILKLAAG